MTTVTVPVMWSSEYAPLPSPLLTVMTGAMVMMVTVLWTMSGGSGDSVGPRWVIGVVCECVRGPGKVSIQAHYD